MSEHAKDTGYSVDGASVKIIGQETMVFDARPSRPYKHSCSPTGNESLSRLRLTLNLWNNSKQFYSLIKTMVRITFERQWWRYQVGFRELCVICCCEICWCRRIFLCNIMSEQVNLHSFMQSCFIFCFVICLFTCFLLFVFVYFGVWEKGKW